MSIIDKYIIKGDVLNKLNNKEREFEKIVMNCLRGKVLKSYTKGVSINSYCNLIDDFTKQAIDKKIDLDKSMIKYIIRICVRKFICYIMTVEYPKQGKMIEPYIDDKFIKYGIFKDEYEYNGGLRFLLPPITYKPDLFDIDKIFPVEGDICISCANNKNYMCNRVSSIEDNSIFKNMTLIEDRIYKYFYLKDEGIYLNETGIFIAPKRKYKIYSIKIVQRTNYSIVYITYCARPKFNYKPDRNRKLSIDLGVNNLCTCVSNTDLKPFIINGKILKSWIQLHNKVMKRLGAYKYNKDCVSEHVIMNKGIRRKRDKHKRKYLDYIHKSTRIIINKCIEHNIGTIIVGYNNDWKLNNLGRLGKAAQGFLCMPFGEIIRLLMIKSKAYRIKVIITEESYTSKTDHFAFEEMSYKKKWLGRRIKRGLFVSSNGNIINADVNGAIGIGRKVFGDSYVREIINSGVALTPVRVNPLQTK